MITLSKVSKWYPNFSGAESLLDGSRQGRSRRGVRSIGLWQVDAHQMRQRWRDLASTVRSEPDSASGSHGHALRRRGERNAGNGARRGRHVHVHHDGSGRVLAEWGKPSTSTASPSRRCNTPVCTENLVRIDLMRESLNVGHDGRADISLRAGLYKDRANKANVKIGQRKCHITST